MMEEPVQFGEGGRLFGILTLPDDSLASSSRSVFVFLNAGLLHRTGPHRLHVRLARELAAMGIPSLRVDIAGRGDSLPPPVGPNQETVAADFVDIMQLLECEFGDVTVVLAGLCSGADNAIRLVSRDPRVIGMLLLDPVCEKDDGFAKRALGYSTRALIRKCTTPSKYGPWIRRSVASMLGKSEATEEPADNLSIRDLPTVEQTRNAFETIRDRDGRVLAVFTQYALEYYNQAGQLQHSLAIDDFDQFCAEIFWPHIEHTYPFNAHRQLLVDEVIKWEANETG